MFDNPRPFPLLPPLPPHLHRSLHLHLIPLHPHVHLHYQRLHTPYPLLTCPCFAPRLAPCLAPHLPSFPPYLPWLHFLIQFFLILIIESFIILKLKLASLWTHSTHLFCSLFLLDVSIVLLETIDFKDHQLVKSIAFLHLLKYFSYSPWCPNSEHLDSFHPQMVNGYHQLLINYSTTQTDQIVQDSVHLILKIFAKMVHVVLAVHISR